MGRHRNPNPPIKHRTVKLKDATADIWYVTEQDYQFDHSLGARGSNKVLKSRRIGVVFAKDEDVRNMIPIDEWNAQKKQERRLAKQKKAKPVTPKIEDARDQERVRYKPEELFVILLAAFCAGFTNCQSAASFVNSHNEEFSEIFGDFKGLEISHDTIRRFFILLGKDCNGGLLQLFNQLLIDASEEKAQRDPAWIRQFSADGQAVRATRISAGSRKARYILSIHDNEYGLVVSQEVVGEKTTEVTHVAGLLKALNIRGSLVTADALHSNPRFINAVLEGGADYLIKIKENQGTTYEWFQTMFSGEPLEEVEEATEETRDYGHGRIETRSIRVIPGSKLCPQLKKKWPEAEGGCIAQLTSKRDDLAKNKKSEEVTYLVSSLSFNKDYVAKQLLVANRGHWQIETSHWVLDVIYHQDKTQCKNGEFLQGKTLFNKILRNFVLFAKKIEEERLGKPLSHEELKGICTNIQRFYQLYMETIKKRHDS